MNKNNIKQVSQHLIFWLIYFLLWGARDLIYHSNYFNNVVSNVFFNLSVIPFVYVNLYILVPRFLLKKRVGIFILAFVFCFLVVLFTRYETYQFFFLEFLEKPETAINFQGWPGIVILSSENTILILVSMALYLVNEWYAKEKYTLELEQKNVQTELVILKNQLQPHFLFNNLNTIYLLMETDPELAKKVMIQFSDVLSHQLYNAKKDKVLLSEELDYLRSYIEIQHLRHSDFMKLKYELPENTGVLEIAPMILVTFIENAFKHAINDSGYHVTIQLKLEGNELNLQVSNSIGEHKETKAGGVGLENVRRRLELIYSKKHELLLEATPELYTVDLKILLD